MFLYSLIVFVLTFAATAEQNVIVQSLDTLGTIAVLVMFGAIYVFLGGIGVAGWIRSRTTGILTSAFAAVTMCVTSFAIISVLSVF